ncbi:MAG: iron-sulfur cluster-binding protein [Promethearchaeota archaeon CR_4]|nr:MAG: iron-sulfur cluster-binding protein [Candidatus Lokiarchaeota archaeon CR_4]
MILSKNVKKLAKSFGLDLCGIAPADKFTGAPDGFKPTDIYPKCKSVIVFAKKLPSDILESPNRVPYTHATQTILQDLDRIGLAFSDKLADEGVNSIPIPADDPYEYWEPERSYGRAILSLRHAGYLAGLGVIGINNLLVNEKYGNLICLGSILVDVTLEPDTIINRKYCIPNCFLCLKSCPQKALDGKTVDQQLCRKVCKIKTEKGYNLFNCNICRKVCPNRTGVAKR